MGCSRNSLGPLETLASKPEHQPELVLGNRTFSREDEFHHAQRAAHLLMAMEDDDFELERGPEDDLVEDVLSA